MLQIDLISARPEVDRLLGPYLERYGISLSHSLPQQLKARHSIACIMLYEPAKLEEALYTRASAYYAYLLGKFPTAKLITLGLQEGWGPYHLNLFALPTDFLAYYDAVPAVNAISLESYSSTHTIEQRLQHFFRGHGASSFIETASQFKMSLHTLSRLIGEPATDEDKEKMLALAKLEWHTLVDRWLAYQVFFRAIPLDVDVHRLTEELMAFEVLFKGTSLTEKMKRLANEDWAARFEQMVTTLKEIETLYQLPTVNRT